MLFNEPNQQVGFHLPKSQNPLENQMVAMAKDLAKSQVRWTPTQKKLFVMVLTQVNWSKSGNNNVIELDKTDIMAALKLDINASDRSTFLRKEFRKLALNSFIEWTDPEDKEIWEDGFLLTNWGSSRHMMRVVINPYYMPMIENLVGNYPFLTMWSNDIYSFKSKFTFALFEELRLNYDSRFFTNERAYTTKQLKELFGLSKEDYVKPNGKFNRSVFEERTINTARDEINAGDMMTIVSIEKVKKNGMVAEYRFRYFVKTRQHPTEEQKRAMAEDEQLQGQMSVEDYLK